MARSPTSPRHQQHLVVTCSDHSDLTGSDITVYVLVSFCCEELGVANNRVVKEFFLPTEASDVVFLKNRIAVLCARGFEIMELSEFVFFFHEQDQTF